MKILYFEDQEDDRDLLIKTFRDRINNDVEFTIVWLGEYPQAHDYTGDRWKIVPGEGARIYTREGFSEAPVDPLHPREFDAAILDMFRAGGVFDGEAFTTWLGQGKFLGPVILHSRYAVPAEVPNLPRAHVISKHGDDATLAVIDYLIGEFDARPIPAAVRADQPLAAFWASISDARNPPARWLAYWTASADRQTGRKVMSFFQQRTLYGEDVATWPDQLEMLVKEKECPKIVWVSCESVNDGIVKEIDRARHLVHGVIESLRDHWVKRKSETWQSRWRRGIGNGAARPKPDFSHLAESRIPYRYPLVAALANRIDQSHSDIGADLLQRGAVAVARDQLLDCPVGWLEQSVENFIRIYESLLEDRNVDSLQKYYRRYLRLLIAGRHMSYVYPNSRHTSLLEEFSTRAHLPQTMSNKHRAWRCMLVDEGLLSEAAANAFK